MREVAHVAGNKLFELAAVFVVVVVAHSVGRQVLSEMAPLGFPTFLLGICGAAVAFLFAQEVVAVSAAAAAADVAQDRTVCSSRTVKSQLQAFATEVGSVASFSDTPLNWLTHAKGLTKTLAECTFQPLALVNLTVDLRVSSNAARKYDLAAWGSRRGWPRFLENPTSSLDDGPGGDSSGTHIAVPSVDFVLRSYLASRRFELRQLLLALLNVGVDPDLVTPWTADDPPPFLQECKVQHVCLHPFGACLSAKKKKKMYLFCNVVFGTMVVAFICYRHWIASHSTPNYLKPF